MSIFEVEVNVYPNNEEHQTFSFEYKVLKEHNTYYAVDDYGKKRIKKDEVDIINTKIENLYNMRFSGFVLANTHDEAKAIVHNRLKEMFQKSLNAFL
jgi:hypothetical protein